MEKPLVQILVVVAIIQIRILKIEEEKGSMWTAIVHGLSGPKGKSSIFKRGVALLSERELG